MYVSCQEIMPYHYQYQYRYECYRPGEAATATLAVTLGSGGILRELAFETIITHHVLYSHRGFLLGG